jgi:hypothetical protein
MDDWVVGQSIAGSVWNSEVADISRLLGIAKRS